MKEGQNTNTSTNFSKQLEEYRRVQAGKWKGSSEKNHEAPQVSNNNNEAQNAPIPDGKQEIEDEKKDSAISPPKKITQDKFLSILVDRLCSLESGKDLLNEFVIIAIKGYEMEDSPVVYVLKQMQKDFELTEDEILNDYFNLTQDQITNICEILLQKRQDVDIDFQDSIGRTALHIAASYNRIAIADYLLQKRCDITKETYEFTSDNEGLAFSDAVSEGNMGIATLIVLAANERKVSKEYFTRLLVDLFYISEDKRDGLKYGMRKDLSAKDRDYCIRIVEQLLLGGANLAADVYEISKDADDAYEGLTIFDLAKNESPHMLILLDGIVLALKNSKPKYTQTRSSSVALINNSLLLKNREMGNIKLTQMPQYDTAGWIIFSVIRNFDNVCIEYIKNRISGKWLKYQWEHNLTFLNTHTKWRVEGYGGAIDDAYIKNIYVLLATFNVGVLPNSFKRDCISLLLIEANDEIFIETVIKYNLVIDANIIQATRVKLLEILRKNPNRFPDLFLNKNKFVISLILWMNEIHPGFKNALLFHMLRCRKNMDGMGAKLRSYIQPKILQGFKSWLDFFQVFQEKIFEEWKNELVGLPTSSPHAQITPTDFYDFLCQKIHILVSSAKQSNDNNENNREFPGDKRKRGSEEIDDAGSEARDNNNTMEPS